jgi:hypothetical protein
MGLWGPYGQYIQGYHSYVQLHNDTQTSIALAVGKKYKPTRAPTFHDLFPYVDAAMSLGTAAERRREKSNSELAIKAASALISEDAPAWLRENL